MPPVSGSIASLTDVVIHGGDGEASSFGNFSGAKAIMANASTLVLSKATLTGGDGYSLPGGTGLALTNGATAWLSSVQVNGGSGTPAGNATTVDASSSLIPVADSTHTLTTSSPGRQGELLTVTVQGVPGEAVVLKTGLKPALAFDGAGAFRLTQPIPAMSRFLGVVPAGGTLTFSTPVPDLGALPSLQLFLQAWHIDALGHTRAAPGTPNFQGEQGPGSSVLLLGEGY